MDVAKLAADDAHVRKYWLYVWYRVMGYLQLGRLMHIKFRGRQFKEIQNCVFLAYKVITYSHKRVNISPLLIHLMCFQFDCREDGFSFLWSKYL